MRSRLRQRAWQAALAGRFVAGGHPQHAPRDPRQRQRRLDARSTPPMTEGEPMFDWIALATLAALEIVLGVDNIIFISILVARVPEAQRNLARRLGLALAMLTRIALLLSLAWIMRLTTPLFTLVREISGRDRSEEHTSELQS